jgi:hypothetical protein
LAVFWNCTPELWVISKAIDAAHQVVNDLRCFVVGA